MNELELKADNGQLVYAIELDDFVKMVYGMMDYEVKAYSLDVYREQEPTWNDTLEDVAPLHLAFYDTWEEAASSAHETVDAINAGTFTYVPPVLPA